MPLARAAMLVAVVALAAVGLSGHSRKPTSVAKLQQAVGAYRFEDGRIAALFIEPFGKSLRIVDYDSGLMRQLERRSGEEFVAGPRLGATRPIESLLRLVRDASGKI